MTEPVSMSHPGLGAVKDDVQPAQVPSLLRSGWVLGDNADKVRDERIAELEEELATLKEAKRAASERQRAIGAAVKEGENPEVAAQKVDQEQASGRQAKPSGHGDDSRTVPELQQELRDLGQPTSGTKAELVERLAAASAENDKEQ